MIRQEIDEEQLWAAKVDVLTIAFTREEAEENIKKGVLLVNEVLDIELDNLDHLTGKSRERMRERIYRALRRLDREHPGTLRWGFGY